MCRNVLKLGNKLNVTHTHMKQSMYEQIQEKEQHITCWQQYITGYPPYCF